MIVKFVIVESETPPESPSTGEWINKLVYLTKEQTVDTLNLDES